jgi:carbonic anhydrase/acetyltransferase-like protein (isoleucine patch superfamily)
VTFRGAKPAARPPLREDKTPDGTAHPNGGGFVAKSAKVAPTAFVGPNARVLDGAEVSGNARIEDHALVRQSAKVSGDAIIGGFARVTDRARVDGRARVRGYARVGDQATVTENARVLDYATVDGRGTVSGDVIIRGFGEIHLQPATPLTGGTVCGEDLEVHFMGSELPELRGGMIYGYLNKDLIKKELADNRYRYAHWTFDRGSKEVLRDDNADCEGVLRGAVKFAEADGRKFAAFDGRSYALVEGHVVDTRNATFDVELAWSGGAAGQRVFEFGDSEASVLLAIAQGGRPAFVVRRGKEASSVMSALPLVPNRWSRVTVSLQDGTARIFVDGKPAGEQKGFAFALEDIQARSGRIGAGVAGAGFQGKLDRLTVYRTGFPSMAEVPAP